MRFLKAILRQGVDIGFLIIMFGLLIWWMINPKQNFTGALLLVCGYIVFNIINKAILSEYYKVVKKDD